jgi:hypothetical protein
LSVLDDTETRLYVPGSGLEVPGLEAVIEYGDSSSSLHGRIPGALLINDKTDLTRVRLSGIDGLHDDPDGRDSRSPNAGRHGERAGVMLYGGRTIGLTGKVEAGSVKAMRDLWRRMRATFGVGERDLVLHVPSEVGGWTNSLYNPSLDSDASYWAVTSTATASGLSGGVVAGVAHVGQVSVTAAGASVTSVISQESTPWNGEDVYVSARVRVIASAGSVSSLRVGVSLSDGDVAYTSQASPVSGTWYRMSIRFPSSDIWADPTKLGLLVQAETTAAATFQVQWDECVLVLLAPDEDTPVGYLDGDVHGFEWSGVPGRSPSTGPHYAVNLIPDPTFADTDASLHLQSWTTSVSPGSTVTMPPTRSLQHLGTVDASVTARFVKDATSTPHDFNVFANDLTGYGGASRVYEGRTYRLSFTVFKDPAQTPLTGDICARIFWVDVSGTLSTASRGASMVDAAERLSVTATAPAGSAFAWLNVSLTGVTTPSATWHLWATDPCFVDVTDYDPGDFYGVDGEFLESAAVVSPRRFARRRIPRPFVVRRVRKTSDMKAPERQAGLRATRDFTMSLRAADPRVYVMGDRHAALRMTGTPKFVSINSPSGFTLETGGLPVPSGFTYEGHYVTHPGTGALYRWSQRANFVPTDPVNPAGGVIFRAFDDPASGAAPSSTQWGNNRPAQNIRTRLYRSLEGFTYGEPRVVVGGTPGSNYRARGSTPYAMSIADITLGGGLTKDNTDLDFSALTLLVKRVSATTWLELRWNSVSHAWFVANGYGANPQAAWPFELWCSHNTSGTLATTRLASWEYASYDSSSSLYPFNRVVDPMWLVSWVLSNTVHWELWRSYPSLIDVTGRVESGSFALPAPLQSVVGSGVAGSPGWSIDVERSNSQLNFAVISATPPYVHYYEQSDASLPPQSITVPVIGDVDTPQVLQLRGDVVDPTISISVPAYDDLPARTSVARFTGTTSDTNPITVDLERGTVTDSFGQNSYEMLLTGSDFTSLRPGKNVVSLQARSWGSYPSHLLVSWRDALV